MRIKKESIAFVVTLGAIFGYPLVAGLSTTLDLPNRPISLAMRASIALLSLYLILSNINKTTAHLRGIRRVIFLCTSIFVFLYLLRLTTITAFSPLVPLSTAIDFWVWAVGAMLLPVVGLSMARSYDTDWSSFYRLAFIVSFFASLLVAINASTYVTNEFETYDSGRARLETLNPILFGHLGASLFLLSLSSLWQNARKRRKKLVIFVVGVALGSYLLITANSRGPFFSTAAALFFAVLVLSGRNKGIFTLMIIFVAIGLAPLLLWIENNLGITTYTRLFGQSLSYDVSVVARKDLYLAALQDFADYPFFGVGPGLTEPGLYPHNVTIEAFMTVGILGGLLFSAMQFLVFILLWQICRARRDLIWISMIVIQYVVAAQFSGALHSSAQFWAVIGVAVFAGGTMSPSAARRREAVVRNQLIT